MKRGGPIRRRKPLRAKNHPKTRRTRLRPVRLKPRRQAATRDPEYLAWVRTQPCAACRTLQFVARTCPRARSDAHHAGAERGLGQKASDDTAIPMGRAHHGQLEDLTGDFKGWTRERLREWQDAEIVFYRLAYAAHRLGATAIPW